MNREFGDVSSETCLNETEKEEDQSVTKNEDPFYEKGTEETKEERSEEENETEENETGENVMEETATEENDEEEQPAANVAMSREELQKMLDDFKSLCKNHLRKLTDAASAFSNESEETQNQEQQKLKKKRKLKLKKKPKLLYNLIMICMMIVLLMQIHMYLLLYNKFSTVHQEIKGVSCAIFGKNCPDPKKAYECLKNKMDFTEIENIRALAILQRNIEELFFTVNNISDTVKLTYYHFVLNKDEDDDENDKSNANSNDIKFNKPPRTRTIYINP